VTNVYLLDISTMFLLHVSLYLISSSGRTYVPLTQNHLLLRSFHQWLIQQLSMKY